MALLAKSASTILSATRDRSVSPHVATLFTLTTFVNTTETDNSWVGIGASAKAVATAHTAQSLTKRTGVGQPTALSAAPTPSSVRSSTPRGVKMEY